MGKLARSYGELDVYQEAFRLSKTWPPEEKYALTDQIRRSSRSIGACVAESWAKRRYPAHFLSKLTDADAELQETMHWVDTAAACAYLADDDLKVLFAQLDAIGRMLGAMIRQHESFAAD